MRRVRRLTTTGLATLGVLAGGLVLASDPALAAAPEKPATEPATAVTATTATLNGVLNPLVEAPTPGYYFTYSTNGTCEESTTEAVAEEPAVKVKALKVSTATLATPVTGLQPNKEYMFCVVATHLEGEETQASPSTAASFKTEPAAPKVDGESISGVGSTTATLEAQVNPNNEATTSYLQYSASPAVNVSGALETATPASPPPGPEIGANYEDHPVGPAALTSLVADTTYYYQAVAANATGTTYGPVQTFTTQGAPVVSTGEAQNITRSAATFSGTVTPNGAETTYYFAYIDQAGYETALAGDAKEKGNLYAEGETTSAGGAGASYEPQAVGPIPTASLLPETTYHYALVAKNEVGVTIGPDETLTTLARTPPTVSTGGASGVSQNAATISGTVDTNSLQTNYGFEIGTEPNNYGPATGLGSIGGAAVEGVALTLGELQPGTTYYYRVEATNADGTSQGAPALFTTPGFPTLLTAPASPPLIGTPSIVFPAEAKESATGTTTKTLTKAQKLAAALKACKKEHGKQKQARCERQARAKYGPAKKKGGRK